MRILVVVFDSVNFSKKYSSKKYQTYTHLRKRKPHRRPLQDQHSPRSIRTIPDKYRNKPSLALPLFGSCSANYSLLILTGIVAINFPFGSTIPLIPLVVARAKYRPVSTARIRAICMCCAGPREFPIHASSLICHQEYQNFYFVRRYIRGKRDLITDGYTNTVTPSKLHVALRSNSGTDRIDLVVATIVTIGLENEV